MLVKWNHNTTPAFSRLLDDFFNTDLGVVRGADSSRTTPYVNVVEGDNNFRVEVAAPGLNKEDFSLSIDEDRLTIKAQKEVQNEETKEKYTRREFGFHSFERSFTLPETVDQEAITAAYENGVLNVTLPKKEIVEPPVRNIEVK